MRNLWLSAVLILGSCFFTFSQTSPNDPGAASSPGTAPAAQDPAQPQNQIPPDGKAPAPTENAKTSDSSASQAPSAQSAGPRYLLAGADIRAALDTPLSTKTSKVGDRFTATVVAPVHDSSGNVVIPVGAKLNGQISEPADERLEATIKDMGHLNLRFTDIQPADGPDIPLSAVLISVHNSKPASSATVGNTHPAQPGSSAIAGNPGSVAALGRPIRGVAVGNLAGGGYVLSTTSKRVELPAESVLRLRVDRNTPIP